MQKEVIIREISNKIVISPSLLGCNFLHIEDQLQKMKDNGIKVVHYDVMDGHFVDNISFGESIFPLFKKSSDFIYDVHLMVANPLKHTLQFLSLGADMVSVHIENFSSGEEVVNFIKTVTDTYNNACLGVVIKPNTDDSLLFNVLDLFDYVLVMTVEPGKGGQKFNYDMLPRIKKLDSYIKDNNLSVVIEVDGGINAETTKLAVENGATMLVAGSYLFAENGNKMADNITEMLKGVIIPSRKEV